MSCIAPPCFITEPVELIPWLLPITNPQEIYTSEETYLSKLKMLDEVRNILYSFHSIDGLGIQACW